jgi:hypothetical protein
VPIASSFVIEFCGMLHRDTDQGKKAIESLIIAVLEKAYNKMTSHRVADEV